MEGLLARGRRTRAPRPARGVRAVLSPPRDAARQQRAGAGARRRARPDPRGRAGSRARPRARRGVGLARLRVVRERFGRALEGLADVRLEQLDQRGVPERRPGERPRPATAHVGVVEDLTEVPAAAVLAADVGEEPLLSKRLPRAEEIRRAYKRSRVCHRTMIYPDGSARKGPLPSTLVP